MDSLARLQARLACWPGPAGLAFRLIANFRLLPASQVSLPILDCYFVQGSSLHIVNEASHGDVSRDPRVGFYPLYLLPHVGLEVLESVEVHGGNDGDARLLL